MNHYLYAIVDQLPACWRQPPGVGGARVLPRRTPDGVILASLLDTVPAASPRTLALHQDVVATLADAAATLPFPYGTMIPGGDLSDWLAAHRTEVAAALTAVRGCVEMTVKIVCLDAIGRLAGRPGGRPAGRAVGAFGERDLERLALMLVERAALPDWRYRPSPGMANVAAAVAFLVPRPELTAFLARIAPVASHASGVAVVPTGPGAPYSFVPDLGRVPPPGPAGATFETTARQAG